MTNARRMTDVHSTVTDVGSHEPGDFCSSRCLIAFSAAGVAAVQQ